ncbi:hypothetical protein DL771_009898 [Monosporascus sp. 5C6A]|nr:hypothetical protein DL771_009898 [Monosporascus sp. 5C6A]
MSDLCSFRSVTSEKNVWAFRDKGLESMYPSYRCTVLNWNVYNYVGRGLVPDCFVNRTMGGSHAGQQSADLVRLPLLFEHGGVWMDVGNMLHTHLGRLFWEPLTAPDSPYEMGVWITSGQIRKQWRSFGNYMLAAREGGRTNADGFHKLPLVQDIAPADGMADWDFQDKIRKMSDYVAHMFIADLTRNLLDASTGWNGPVFFESKVELFTTPLDEPDTEKRQAAEDFVIDMLEKSHMNKVYRNSAGGLPALGDLIEKEGFRVVDHRPGTLARCIEPAGKES